MPQITKRQHTVPRNYLRAWAHKNSIAACVKGKTLNSVSLDDVGQEKYFYSLEDLNCDETVFVLDFLQRQMKMPDSAIISHFSSHILPFILKKVIENKTDNDTIKIVKLLIDRNLLHKELANVLRNTILLQTTTKIAIDATNSPLTEWIKNGEEPINCNIENDAWPYLDSAIRGDLSFFSDRQSSEKFILFLIHQLFRTCGASRLAKDVLDKIGGNVRGEKVFTYLRLPLIYRIHDSLCSKLDTYQLILINNNTNLEFITGDQPLLNLIRDNPPIFFDLYFPISPHKALLLCTKERANSIYCNINNCSRECVDYLNRKICDVSEGQIYASNAQVITENGYSVNRLPNSPDSQ